jgi:hypothetical protein
MANQNAAILWIIRTLACLAALSVTTVCVLAYRGTQIPPELNTLTGGLVGALSSMLVNTKSSDRPAPVEIKQPEGDPVPVKETPTKP